MNDWGKYLRWHLRILLIIRQQFQVFWCQLQFQAEKTFASPDQPVGIPELPELENVLTPFPVSIFVRFNI